MPALVVIAVIGSAVAACQPAETTTAPLPSAGKSTPAGEVSVAEAFSEGGSLFVPAKTALEAQRQGLDVLFVDARTPLDYEYAHIPGAINVPYYEPEKYLGTLPRDRWIVAYCECPHAESQQLADVLLANGFTKVRVINEGLQGWRDAGGPVAEKPQTPPPGGTTGTGTVGSPAGGGTTGSGTSGSSAAGGTTGTGTGGSSAAAGQPSAAATGSGAAPAATVAGAAAGVTATSTP